RRQRHENLAAKWMAFYQPQGNGYRFRQGTHDAYSGFAIGIGNIDPGQIGVAFAPALIHGRGLVALHFDDITVGCKSLPSQGIGMQGQSLTPDVPPPPSSSFGAAAVYPLDAASPAPRHGVSARQ